MDDIPDPKLFVQDLAVEGCSRRADLLEPWLPEPANDEAFLRRERHYSRMYGDGLYVVLIGTATMQVWCFDEETTLHQEIGDYRKERSLAAECRAKERITIALGKDHFEHVGPDEEGGAAIPRRDGASVVSNHKAPSLHSPAYDRE